MSPAISFLLVQLLGLLAALHGVPRLRAYLKLRYQRARVEENDYIQSLREISVYSGPSDSAVIFSPSAMQSSPWRGTKDPHSPDRGMRHATQFEQRRATRAEYEPGTGRRYAGRHLPSASPAQWSLGGAATALGFLVRRLREPVRGQHRHRREDRPLRPGSGDLSLIYAPRHYGEVAR